VLEGNLETSRHLAEKDYRRLDQLLRTHFAKFSTEMIWLASICLGTTMMLAILIVIALRI